MAGLFPPWSDRALRIALVLVALIALGLPVALMVYVRTPYVQDVQLVVEQPVQFDHRHHVQDDGIECLYCHSGAERSARAGVPATEKCMGCHAQVWQQSPLLEKVRTSFYNDTPLAWTRVHDLPDFVQFNHSVHVAAGVQCRHCHGDVERMPLVHKARALTMDFCLDCHRDPPAHIAGYVAAKGASHPPLDSGFVGDTLTSCTACHR